MGFSVNVEHLRGKKGRLVLTRTCTSRAGFTSCRNDCVLTHLTEDGERMTLATKGEAFKMKIISSIQKQQQIIGIRLIHSESFPLTVQNV